MNQKMVFVIEDKEGFFDCLYCTQKEFDQILKQYKDSRSKLSFTLWCWRNHRYTMPTFKTVTRCQLDNI